MEYDLLLKGGRVIDPKNDLDGPADVGVKDGKIAAVGPGLEGAAAKTVDVAGLYVTPGLIDIHLHAYGRPLSLDHKTHTSLERSAVLPIPLLSRSLVVSSVCSRLAGRLP